MEEKNLIDIFVTPKSRRDLLCGLEADVKGNPLLKIKVMAKPNDGQANVSVCKTIAKSIHVPKSFVTIKRGQKSRYKQIQIKCSKQKFDNWIKNLL